MSRLIPADVRQALRRLAATPLLSLAAVVTLALGIGSAVVMVDVLDRLLLRAPPHVTDPERVARVYIGIGESYFEVTRYATFDGLAAMHDEFESTAAYFTESRPDSDSPGRAAGSSTRNCSTSRPPTHACSLRPRWRCYWSAPLPRGCQRVAPRESIPSSR